MYWKRLFVGLVAMLFIISMTSAWVFMRIHSGMLEVGGQVFGEAIHNTEMEDLRGAYLDIDFSTLVNFANRMRSAPVTQISATGNTAVNSLNNNQNIIYYNQSTNTQNTQTNQTYINGKFKSP